MSADEALGLVYLPFGTPTNDFYGGHRPGANLFAESIVAVDARTGARKWHFQAVHHGVWDYDLPARRRWRTSPSTAARIQALAQVSKQGFTYVLDRRTGVPVWPIEERPVPQSDDARRAVVPDAAVSVEAAGLRAPGADRRRPDRLHARAAAAGHRGAEALRSRAAVHAALGDAGRFSCPAGSGGANWGGAAFDPESRTAVRAVDDQPDAGAAGQARPGEEQLPAAPRRADGRAVHRRPAGDQAAVRPGDRARPARRARRRGWCRWARARATIRTWRP